MLSQGCENFSLCASCSSAESCACILPFILEVLNSSNFPWGTSIQLGHFEMNILFGGADASRNKWQMSARRSRKLTHFIIPETPATEYLQLGLRQGTNEEWTWKRESGRASNGAHQNDGWNYLKHKTTEHERGHLPFTHSMHGCILVCVFRAYIGVHKLNIC